MNDTTPEIYERQFEIFFAKSLRDRFLMNLELTEFVRETTRRRIRRLNPDFSEFEVKKEMFRQFYCDCFSEEQMQDIFSTWKVIYNQ